MSVRLEGQGISYNKVQEGTANKAALSGRTNNEKFSPVQSDGVKDSFYPIKKEPSFHFAGSSTVSLDKLQETNSAPSSKFSVPNDFNESDADDLLFDAFDNDNPVQDLDLPEAPSKPLPSLPEVPAKPKDDSGTISDQALAARAKEANGYSDYFAEQGNQDLAGKYARQALDAQTVLGKRKALVDSLPTVPKTPLPNQLTSVKTDTSSASSKKRAASQQSSIKPKHTKTPDQAARTNKKAKISRSSNPGPTKTIQSIGELVLKRKESGDKFNEALNLKKKILQNKPPGPQKRALLEKVEGHISRYRADVEKIDQQLASIAKRYGVSVPK